MVKENVFKSTARLYTYDCKSKSFTDSGRDGKIVLADQCAGKVMDLLEQMSASEEPAAFYTEVCAKNAFGDFVQCNAGFICAAPGEQIIVTLSETEQQCGGEHELDELTGLLNRDGFSSWIRNHKEIFLEQGDERYIVVYFDVLRLKVVNDMFGLEEGDRLLKHIGTVVADAVRDHGAACRMDSDRFVFIARCQKDEMSSFVDALLDRISDFDLPFEIMCNAGIYVVSGNVHSMDSLIDRAIMAQASIKGSYTKRYTFFTEDLRRNLLSEQEITGMMKAGLENEEFVIHYQPQYNHSTGMLVGAEALVRWKHPEKGLIPPGLFIPVFEKNGFITKLDLYVFEKVCRFIKKCLDKNLPAVPISTNLTRYDIFTPNFIEKLEETRQRYDVPSQYIRVEITESAALGNSQYINEAVKKLHSYGYVVEMDDFGSGYSSLNILKDIDFDMIKLDMRFLETEHDKANRGGTILSSVVRMVNWLGLPVIAEGVETVKQADFLRSIGCDYIQGYLYSKPLPEEEYEVHIQGTQLAAAIPQMKLMDTLNAANFWSNDSLETLIFSNFVGGAAIFDYKEGRLETLRVNQKYLTELGMNLTEKEIIHRNPLDFFDDAGKEAYMQMLKRAIETEEEQECETWRTITSSCCGEERLCIRSTVRMIGKSKDTYLFYAMIRNITSEKKRYDDILDSERRFKMASEQVNIYYWEYTVATKEMRPCFRCMRDLGLPALMTNYPESAIEMGVFPPETADMYRDWHRQIAEGVPKLEAVIPLTVGRIPFTVRYTTEFDENGRPVKAYGSAALVV